MKKIKIGKKEVEIYDSIDELPVTRYHRLNKMLLIDAGIGSDIADIDRHIEKAVIYIRNKQHEMAATELNNLRQNIYNIQTGLSPKNLAFAAIVKSIDGRECNDLTDDGLRATIELLSNEPQKEITTSLEEVKKKIDEELQMYFPQLFDDATIKEYYDELRRRTLAVIDLIINGETEERLTLIEKITTNLLIYNKPRVFTGVDNMEITYDKQFERMCIMLAEQLNVEPKKYTVMEYYNAFEYMKEKIKNQTKAIKRNKAV